MKYFSAMWKSCSNSMFFRIQEMKSATSNRRHGRRSLAERQSEKIWLHINKENTANTCISQEEADAAGGRFSFCFCEISALFL